jgi:ABC-type thiamin/hydroxymethylpyrimidine transport system permease subunit
MLAKEHIQGFKWKDVLLIALFSLVSAALMYGANAAWSPSTSFIVSLIVLAGGMNVVVHVVQKTGTAVLFYTFVGFATLHIDDLGVFGWQKIGSLFLAALVFEAAFLILKFHVRSVSVDMVAGTSFSIASIPLFSAFLLSPAVVQSFPLEILNITLLAFILGLSSSLAAAVFWMFISKSMFMIELDTYLKVA